MGATAKTATLTPLIGPVPPSRANSDGRFDGGVGVELLTDLDGRARGVCPVYDASRIVSLILINPGL